MPASFDLWKLIFSPEDNSKPFRIAFSVITLVNASSHKNKISFANCRMHSSTSFLPNLRLDSRLVFTACLTSLARPSTTTIKRKGAKGSSFLNPLDGLNSSVGLPFVESSVFKL